MDVKISSDKTEQIVVYENDDLEEVIVDFASRNGLSQSKRDRLLEIIKIQLKKAIIAKEEAML